MSRRIASAMLLALALSGTAVAAAPPASDWRGAATVHDRQRLRDWHRAWSTALDQVRAGGGGTAMGADPILFAPDTALPDGALPDAGDYRCRRTRLGARLGAPALATEAWGRCRIDGERPPRRLAGLDGVQRPAGLIYADGDRRAVFLGTMMFPDERRPVPYGHAAGRDMAGLFERIGERRWRLVLPYPRFGAVLDVIELVPVGS